MTQILVVSYSDNDSTRTIARQLARACKADLEYLADRSGNSQAFAKERTTIGAALEQTAPTPAPTSSFDPGNYEMVAISTQARFWGVPRVVRAYILENRSQFKRVALVCTHAGFGHARALRGLTTLCGRPAAAALAILEDDITDGRHIGPISRLASMLKTSCKLRAHLNQANADAIEAQLAQRA